MTRFAAVLVVTAVLAPAGAAPVPRHLMKDPPTVYLPTKPGATWEYEDGLTLVVSAVEDAPGRDGVKVVRIEQVVGERRAAYQVAEVSPAGVTRVADASGPLDNPFDILRAPLAVDAAWAFKSSGMEGTKRVVAREAVKVPAGTFDAVCVETDYTFGGQRRVSRAWYAPGVGLVRATQNGADTQVLKSFTPGKG